jgi:DNA-binding NarL/FixJ family response regulator
MAIKVLVAEDHRIVRQGLCALLEREKDVQVVGQAANGREAVALASRLAPHVVIMDVSMPDLNGIEATRQIMASVPRTRVLGLSMHANRHFVTNMFKAGARGYILKDCAWEDLMTAVKQVMADKVYLSQNVYEMMVKDYVELTAASPSAFSSLSAREREVLQFLAEGKSSDHIAQQLCISIKTVDSHRNNIMHKLGLYSVAELTKYAIREGLTSAEC